MEQASPQPISLQPHADPVLTIVQAALEGIKAKHPDITEQELEAARQDIEASVRERQLSLTGRREYKKHRRERSLAISKEMTELGLKVGHTREISVLSILDKNTGRKIDVQSKLSSTGGMTVVYKIVDGKVTLAAGVCSRNDNFDSLCGREIALERFKQGLTVTVEATEIEQINADVLRGYYLELLRKPTAASEH